MNLSQQFLKKSITSLLLIFISSVLYSQSIKNFSIAEGLPGNSIKCMYKDSKGLMWIATETGLCTYDGIEFKVIGEDDGLKYNLIWKITEDDKHTIWLSTYGNGVAKFDGNKFRYYSKKDGLVHDAVRTLYFSKEKQTMVFGTEDGLSIFNGHKFKNFKIPLTKSNRKAQVNFISKFQDKILFSITKEGLFELRINEEDISKSKVIPFRDLKTINYAGYISKNKYYSLNSTNQFEENDLLNKVKSTKQKTTHIWDYTEDNYGKLYGASGIWKIHPEYWWHI
jgi:hypothetical protein